LNHSGPINSGEENLLGAFQVMIGGVLSIVFYSVVLAGLYKVFQITSELGEIKELLKDIKRNSESAPLLMAPHAPDALMRAVNHESYSDAPDPQPVGDRKA
jgi:hypothetical protein